MHRLFFLGVPLVIGCGAGEGTLEVEGTTQTNEPTTGAPTGTTTGGTATGSTPTGTTTGGAGTSAVQRDYDLTGSRLFIDAGAPPSPSPCRSPTTRMTRWGRGCSR